ncbi:MAG: SigE family RNA polymerase sigma factor [Micromonosporaceae bacterium]
MGRYDGFREFVQDNGPALSRTAYLLCGDREQAEDLLQTALARTVARWPQVRRGSNPAGYVRRVMINERTSRWRRRRYTEHLTAEPPDRPATVDDLDATTWRLTLAEALARLPPKQRAVVVLRFYEDQSESETAELLGCSVGTVKSQAHAALKKLRALVPSLDADLAEEGVPS